jgi:protein-S-isoprenylcysteine O-methyltransferase Ste14
MPLYSAHPFWKVIFWTSYCAWIVFEIWVISRDRAAKGSKGDGGSFFLILSLFILGTIGAFAAPGVVPFGHIALPEAPVFYTALALIWCGLALRLWAIETLGRFFRISVLILEEHNLVTTGPYCYLRHPAYAGTLITVTGIGLAMGNWISVLAITGCMLMAYVGRIGFEEKAMRARFGDQFDEYCRRTWAVVPFVW